MANFPAQNAEERAFFAEAFQADVDELVRRWTDAQDNLMALARDPELAALVGSGSSASAAVEQRIGELTRTVEAELSRLREGTIEWVAGPVGREVSAGVEAAAASAGEQGFRGPGLSGTLGVANTQTIGILMDEILMDTEFAISSTRRVMRRHLRATQQLLVSESAINEALLISEARLENSNQRAKRLRKLMAARAGSGNTINVGGRFFSLKNYADIVARTRLAEAAVEGSFQAVVNMGIDLVRISDHGRTDRFCDPHAGKIFSVSGNNSRFPPLRERPPFHPRCRHALLPFVAELKSPRELEFAIARSAGRIEPGVGIQEFFRAAS